MVRQAFLRRNSQYRTGLRAFERSLRREIWIFKIHDLRLTARTDSCAPCSPSSSATETDGQLSNPRKRAHFSANRKEPTETALAGWGAWIRTGEWRSQNPSLCAPITKGARPKRSVHLNTRFADCHAAAAFQSLQDTGLEINISYSVGLKRSSGNRPPFLRRQDQTAGSLRRRGWDYRK